MAKQPSISERMNQAARRLAPVAERQMAERPAAPMDPRQARILAQQMTQGGRAGCCGQ